MTIRHSITTTNSLLASVATYIKDQGLRANFREDESIHLDLRLDGGMGVLLHIIPDMGRGCLSVYGHTLSIPSVPEQRREAVAEYLTRANYGLVIGNFELDMSDGEVRYKTSIPAVEPELHPAMIHELIRLNAYTLQRYADGARAVIFGADPAEAVEDAEGSEE